MKEISHIFKMELSDVYKLIRGGKSDPAKIAKGKKYKRESK